jgi:hypothetical protein
MVDWSVSESHDVCSTCQCSTEYGSDAGPKVHDGSEPKQQQACPAIAHTHFVDHLPFTYQP